jgi:anhydro-N-acetylmuramic acid kinase
MLFIGMMSGTSLDGIDAALVRIMQTDEGIEMQSIASASTAFTPALLAELQALQKRSDDELHRAYMAANALADAYAATTALVLQKANLRPHDICAIGAHGQTIRHRPEHHYSVQLLNGARLAELTQIDTACDFRAADLAAGGEGAPLVPSFHRDVFRHATLTRCIVNIGGIANISMLAPFSSDEAPIGFDTGPGNTLMDYWCLQNLGAAFDRDGAWAASGRVSQPLLTRMMSDSYFSRNGPKSTGRDLFNELWLQKHLDDFKALAPQDIQATLLELTAQSISLEMPSRAVSEIYVCGGGAFNQALMRRLEQLSQPIRVQSTAALGVDPQSVEALAFAWLAFKRVNLQTANLPSVTAAKGLRILGALHKTSAP